jgi:hypothetical protein
MTSVADPVSAATSPVAHQKLLDGAQHAAATGVPTSRPTTRSPVGAAPASAVPPVLNPNAPRGSLLDLTV